MTRILRTATVVAMNKALRQAGLDVTSDRTTAIAEHPTLGVVYRALRKGRADVWIVTFHNNLFLNHEDA